MRHARAEVGAREEARANLRHVLATPFLLRSSDDIIGPYSPICPGTDSPKFNPG